MNCMNFHSSWANEQTNKSHLCTIIWNAVIDIGFHRHCMWAPFGIDWIFFSLHLTFDSISWLNHNKMINQHNHHHYYYGIKKREAQTLRNIASICTHAKFNAQASTSKFSIKLKLNVDCSDFRFVYVNKNWNVLKRILLTLLKVLYISYFFSLFIPMNNVHTHTIEVRMKNQLALCLARMKSVRTNRKLSLDFLPNCNFGYRKFMVFSIWSFKICSSLPIALVAQASRARRSCLLIDTCTIKVTTEKRAYTYPEFAVEQDACNT